jgi:DNA-binding PadR family transcriptional regulator
MGKLTKAQRAVLDASYVCWSATTGRTWAAPKQGDSFPVKPETLETLQNAGLMRFDRKRGGVSFYVPTEAGRKALEKADG